MAFDLTFYNSIGKVNFSWSDAPNVVVEFTFNCLTIRGLVAVSNPASRRWSIRAKGESRNRGAVLRDLRYSLNAQEMPSMDVLQARLEKYGPFDVLTSVIAAQQFHECIEHTLAPLSGRKSTSRRQWKRLASRAGKRFEDYSRVESLSTSRST